MTNETIIKQLSKLPNDLDGKDYPIKNNNELLLDEFIKELELLTNKYNLSIHNWSNGGAWIVNEITKEEACYNFRWNSDTNKYEYESEDK